MMLRRTKVMQTMAQEKPGLFRAEKEWMKNWVKTVREAFQGVSEVHEEARAVAQMEMDRLEKFTEMWDLGLIEATGNAQKSPAKEGGETKYSIDPNLYVDPNEKRTNTWLDDNRLQLPLVTTHDPINKITLTPKDVKGNFSSDTKEPTKTPMQLAYEKAAQKQEREELPDDRALLMAAKAQGKNAEVLTTYQKKVKSLEAMERKLRRQQEALEEARKEKRIATPVTRSLARNDNEGAKSSEGARPRTAAEKVQALEDGIRKTQASIRIHIENRARCKMRNRCENPGCIVGEGLVPSRIAKKCSANSYNLRIRRTFSYTPCCREGASPSPRW